MTMALRESSQDEIQGGSKAEKTRSSESGELERRTELYGLVQSAIERAVHGVNAVRTLDGLPGAFGRHQPHRNMDAPDDQHAIFGFHFAGHFSRQFPIAGINLARFQRTSKSAHHSTSRGGNNVINGRRVRLLEFRGVHSVMFGNGPVDTINYRLRFA